MGGWQEGLLCASAALALTLFYINELQQQVRKSKAALALLQQQQFDQNEKNNKADIGGSKSSDSLSKQELAIIGEVRSCFLDCQGTPRQPGLVPASRARIVFGKGVSPCALDGLAAHSHIWVIFIFHKNNNNDKVLRARADSKGAFTFPAKIKPPRAPTKVGTLSTRTPHRPNPVGLSVVRLVSVDMARRELEVACSDLVDGSPILDIKPFLPAYDSPQLWAPPQEVKVPAWSDPATFTKDKLRHVYFTTNALAELRSECSRSKLYRRSKRAEVELLRVLLQILRVDVSRSPKRGADGLCSSPYGTRFDGLMVDYVLLWGNLTADASKSTAAAHTAAEIDEGGHGQARRVSVVVIAVRPDGNRRPHRTLPSLAKYIEEGGGIVSGKVALDNQETGKTASY